MLTYKQALEDLQSYSNEIIRLRAALAEAEDERKAYIARELYITKARDKAEAAIAELECRYETHIDEIMARTHKVEADIAAAREVIEAMMRDLQYFSEREGSTDRFASMVRARALVRRR